MLHAHIDTLTQFRETLTASDRKRLGSALTEFAKEHVHAELLEGNQERLRGLLAQGRIPPILFQWALAVRDTYPPQMEAAS